jgi:outer membrane receptor protein involved in Fe transport
VYLGSGKSPGYAVFNFSAAYQVDKQLRFFAQINNLFNRKYYTGAQLGPTGITANGSFIAQPLPPTASGADPVVQSTFYAPGAPRTGWIGVRYLFDIPPKK